ncbi:hypothetical protein TOPH_06401 [Tolypocladium ophioglossoides CBS 100239]|uniref:alpha-galactosidase n=1 Tax=Tolypocladium ophioglossoides (strain CBS 100239) TaxID=1163406 RepID=A0A0L0N4E8_TOLOC|nr:hypothetical protein TOPH_06401 [Tolypocladium ophioglossoides CBS 100239]
MADTEKAQPVKEKRQPWPLWKKLAVAAAVFLAVVGLAVGLGVGLTRHHGDDNNNNTGNDNSTGGSGGGSGGGGGGDNPAGRNATWRPKAGVSWQIILRNPVDLSTALSPGVDVFDLDMYENSAATLATLRDSGKRVICYFSAGSYEDWRADKGEFQDSDLGKPLRGWPGERWLRLSSDNVRRIMTERIKYAAGKGCDAVDPDNVDGYQNDNGLGLTDDDSISFMTFLHGEAAKYNMSIGLKNAGDIIPNVINITDFSVNEQCVQHSECPTFAAYITAGKPVFNIEYPDSAPNIAVNTVQDICTAKGVAGFSTVMKKMELDGWVEYCDGNVFETKTGPPSSGRP